MSSAKQIIANRRLLVAAVVLSEILVYHWLYVPGEGIQPGSFSHRFSFPFKIGVEMEGGVPIDTSILGYILFGVYLYRNRIELKQINNLLLIITPILTLLAILRNVHTLLLINGLADYYTNFNVGYLLLALCGWMNLRLEKEIE